MLCENLLFLKLFVEIQFELNRNLFKKGKFTAPVNLSFGADNRSCAIRIPSNSLAQKNNYGKRLEYRVASASADPALCLSAILSAILFGIENDLKIAEQLHGNAFDQQYQLKAICQNLAQAQENFFQTPRNYFFTKIMALSRKSSFSKKF